VSEKSPDIELITAENWHIDFKTGSGKVFYGNHDSATWLQQNNLLIIAGPGVTKGAVSESPARLVDVAPTVLTLLGILPYNMDGITLADALKTPSPSQIQDQIKLNKDLMPLIEALKSQSNSDLDNLSHK
jgi:arylsulfatase A-like enzyme